MSDQIYDKLANVLHDVHERWPDDGFSNHQRLRGLLSDHLPDAEREIRIALDVIDEGVVDVIVGTPEAERGMQIDRLVSRLDTSRGIREDIARQVVQAFAFALGAGGLPSSIGSVLPQTLPLTKNDDWVGVSEAVESTDQPAHEGGATGGGGGSASGEEPAWKKSVGGSRNLLIAAAVVIAAIVFWPSAKQPVNQGGGGQQGGGPQGGQEQPVGPKGQEDPRRDQPPVVGPGPNKPPVNNGATGNATWYDDYGVVWSIQYTATQFQGTANTRQGMWGIKGGTNQQSGMIEYQIFDSSGNILGRGQGQFTDQSHISFRTVDAKGKVIGQGQFHINHAPS